MIGKTLVDRLNEEIINHKVFHAEWAALAFCLEKTARDCFGLCCSANNHKPLVLREQACLKDCYNARLGHLEALTGMISASLMGAPSDA